MENIIKARKREFWGRERFNDVSFCFPDSDKILHANKMILTLCSPVFEAMFFSDLAEKKNPIPIVDVDPVIFEAFLRYIYTEEFDFGSLDDIQNLFYVAHKYEITTIENACESYMLKNLNKFDINELIAFAEMFSMKNLVKLCRLRINHHPRSDLPATWVPFKKGDPLPSGTVFADIDPTTHWPIGIGRFKFIVETQGDKTYYDILPGTFYIKDMYVEVCGYGETHKNYEEFDILCNGDLEWVPTEGGIVAKKSIVGGITYDQQELFVGMTKRDGRPVIGKVQEVHNCFYIPYKDAELKLQDSYLILTDKHEKSEIQRNSHFGNYEDIPDIEDPNFVFPPSDEEDNENN